MQIFAHRGASGHAPENTLEAIQAALDMQTDGIEVDVFEVEGQLVVIHDRWLQRTTSGNGDVRKQSFQYIRSLDAGNGQQVPCLEEVMALIKGRCMLNIEVKNLINIPLLLDALEKAQSDYHFSPQQLLISSFNHRLLMLFKQQAPQYPTGALTASYPLEYAAFAEQLKASSVHINIDFISEHFVADAHQRGLKVYVYTVNEEEDIEAMKALGVDGIFSNYPIRSKRKL